MSELKKRFELTFIDYGEGQIGIEFKDYILKKADTVTPEQLKTIQNGSRAYKYNEILTEFKKELRIIVTKKHSE